MRPCACFPVAVPSVDAAVLWMHSFEPGTSLRKHAALWEGTTMCAAKSVGSIIVVLQRMQGAQAVLLASEYHLSH